MLKPSLLSLIVVSLGLLVGFADEPVRVPSHPFRAGAAVVDISPTKFPAIIAGGFLEGTASKVNDPLHARCLVLDDGRMQLVFAIVDTCMLPRALTEEAKKLASAKCGIPVSHMMISATHTHSAPAAMGCLGTRVDRDYAATLPEKIAEGIVKAMQNLQPAKIGWGAIDDWEHTHNRRWIRKPERKVIDPFGQATGLANMHPGYLSADVIGPSGPVDPGLSLLAVNSLDGKPLAVLANYSQHYFGSGAVSADYYGQFCKQMAKLLGQQGDGNGPFVCAISQGTSGDLMWMDYGSPKKNLDMHGYAAGVAKYAERAWREIRFHDTARLGMVEKHLQLNYRIPDEARLAWAKPIAAKIENELPKNLKEVYAQEALLLHERQSTEITLQALRIGDLSIATLPNEVYALTGLKLKSQSPFKQHFNVELANGGDGYIPPPEQHVLGGYTTWPARTAGLEVQAEPKIVETLLQALEEVTGEQRREMHSEHGSYAQAILAAKPLAYWRLDEAAGDIAKNAILTGPHAKLRPGFAWYLPGVGSGTGVGEGETLTPSTFSGTQINRAVHLAGGEIQTELASLGPHYSIALWFWLGEASGASQREGTLVTLPTGERLIAKQTSDHQVQLMLNGTASKSAMQADDWQFAVLVSEKDALKVYLNGNEQPEIVVAQMKDSPTESLKFGQSLQGKLDELAVFSRSLSPAEIKEFWNLSAIAPERIKREQAREARQKPLAFPESYPQAVEKLQPLVYFPLQVSPVGMIKEDAIRFSAANFAQFQQSRLIGKAEKLGENYSVSLWFRNDLPNDRAAVTAYLFSRGPQGDKLAPGDHLGIGGTYEAGLTGRLLLFNGNKRNQVLSGRTVIPPGSWNHVVFIREAQRVSVYLNGEVKPEISEHMEITAPGIAEYFLGARSDRFAPLQGNMAHFALYDRALTAPEAQQLHAASGRPKGTVQVDAKQPALSPALLSEPVSPEDSLKKIHVPAGFQVELIAAEPLVLDPVAFDWDASGRLWVVEMADYPLGMDNQGKPGGRVRVLEDRNGDGRYEHATLFAEGLNFPTGILNWRDGAIVTAAPEILLLRDTNQDGRADDRRVLIRGLQEGNQQLRANGLRWGLDHWVYVAAGGHHGNHGVNTRLASLLTDKTVLVGSRDFRFRPDTGELEPQSGPTQFGRNRDAWGHWFGSQNSNPLWQYVLPEQYLARNPHFGAKTNLVQLLTPQNPPVFPASPLEKRFHSYNQAGHFTSACGGMIYRDHALFGSAATNAFICEPFHNLVQRAELTPQGATFSARRVAGEENYDFFASEDRWCRPVMVRDAPDGSLWIADMYRYMIEHPEWLPPQGKAELLPHYRAGDDRGRIYRVSKAGMPPYQPLQLESLSLTELMQEFNSANGWKRDKIHQILLWRNAQSATPHLENLARESTIAEVRMHALCVLDGLQTLPPELLVRASQDAHAGVRENALRLMEGRFTPALVTAAQGLVNDPDLKVRLQLAFSMGACTEDAAGELLGKLLVANANDPLMVAAVMSSAQPHLTQLVNAVKSASPQATGELNSLLMTLALGTNNRAALARIIHNTLVSPDQQYSSAQFHDYLQLCDQLALAQTSFEQLAASQPNDELGKLIAQAAALPDQARRAAKQESWSPLERVTAAAVLLRTKQHQAEGMALLRAWLDPQFPVEVQSAVIRQLASSNAAEVPQILAEAWPVLSPTPRLNAFDAWLSREPWAFDLTQRLEKKEVAILSLDTTQRARLLKHGSARIRILAEKVFAATNASREKVVQEYQVALRLNGEAEKGLAVYRRACAACHKHGEEGKEIGPALVSVVSHPPDKILRSILDPSADIQPGFANYSCTLQTGQQLVGIISAESANSVTLKLADGTSRIILRSQIESLQSQNISLMPERLEAVITPQEMADLIAFLRTPVRESKK
jgi:putative membrane-bound dehydrogenase-like protein